MMILHCRFVETIQHERNYANKLLFSNFIVAHLVIERLAVAFVFVHFNSCTALYYNCVYLMGFALNRCDHLLAVPPPTVFVVRWFDGTVHRRMDLHFDFGGGRHFGCKVLPAMHRRRR